MFSENRVSFLQSLLRGNKVILLSLEYNIDIILSKPYNKTTSWSNFGNYRMSLTLFSEVGCNGNSKELKESEVNIAKAGVKFPVKSAIVNGNPWILFSEERFQVELSTGNFTLHAREGPY